MSQLGHPRPHPGPILDSQREETEAHSSTQIQGKACPSHRPLRVFIHHQSISGPAPRASPSPANQHTGVCIFNTKRDPLQLSRTTSAKGITAHRFLPPPPGAPLRSSSEAPWAEPWVSPPNEYSSSVSRAVDTDTLSCLLPSSHTCTHSHIHMHARTHSLTLSPTHPVRALCYRMQSPQGLALSLPAFRAVASGRTPSLQLPAHDSASWLLDPAAPHILVPPSLLLRLPGTVSLFHVPA